MCAVLILTLLPIRECCEWAKRRTDLTGCVCVCVFCWCILSVVVDLDK